MVTLGWLQLALIIVGIGILCGAGFSALIARCGSNRLETIAPAPRFAVLVALAMFPIMAGIGALILAFAPSVLDGMGLVRDHCAHHGGHAFHLCFIHGHPPETTPLIFGGALVFFLWLAAAWKDEFARIRQLRGWSRRLRDLARFDADIDAWTIASDLPIAVTIGFFAPGVYVSRRMRATLSAEQFEAVIAHERAHARRFDSLVKLVVRLCAHFHLPQMREHLLEEIDLACEQACDMAAAEAVGDRVTVAEAILVVERALGAVSLPAAALGFSGSPLERRVRAMLDDSWNGPGWVFLSAASVVFLGLFAASNTILHHAAETLLSYLI